MHAKTLLSGSWLSRRPRSNNVVRRHVGAIPVGALWVGTLLVSALLVGTPSVSEARDDDKLSEAQMEKIRTAEKARIDVIQKVYGSVVAVYGDDQNGGGSGVIFDPSGLALTNHHVIMGAGVSGFGGLADGQLYPWKLVGTDPGGDVAIIKLEGRETFPYSVLADSDTVRVGDWSLAMGNPFILAEDQTPTVTLGIVSGVKRYQYGQGNELVYGNCIQTDSSINPGNSGGPLFNMKGEVIGINGRGSFQDRGRVNVGLGYAISSNQIRNFIPDLLATKLVEHGTLDARFGNRGGKVVCDTLNQDAPIAEMGLELGDELLAFEGQPINNANEFTNLICTLPEEWPAMLTVAKENGEKKTMHVRLLGLPYTPPNPPAKQPEDPDKPKEEPTPDQKRAQEKQEAMLKLLTSQPGTILNQEMNHENLMRLVERWRNNAWQSSSDQSSAWHIVDDVVATSGEIIGRQDILVDRSGRFRLTLERNGESQTFVFDGQEVGQVVEDTVQSIRPTDASANPYLVQLLPLVTVLHDEPLSLFGKLQLDGGDKARQQAAYRLKTLDDLGNWFYVWLSIPEGYDRTDLRLLRASVDLNCKEGAVLFSKWTRTSGLAWPHERQLIQGLEESVQLTIRTKTIETIEAPSPDVFQVGATTDAAGASSVIVGD